MSAHTGLLFSPQGAVGSPLPIDPDINGLRNSSSSLTVTHSKKLNGHQQQVFSDAPKFISAPPFGSITPRNGLSFGC